MCGIVGYVGTQQAAPLLLEGLRRLEYRGYDSSGVAVCGPDGLQVRKAKGRLQALADLRRRAGLCPAPPVSATPAGPPTENPTTSTPIRR